MDPGKDKKLVRLLKRGDRRAFEDLFYKYGQRIYFFAFSFLKNKEDSEGIVQETFYRIWKNRNKIDEFCSFRSFLFTISYNLIMDQFRTRIKEQEFLDMMKSKVWQKELSTSKDVDFHILNAHYQKLIEQLPARRKQIFKMARFEGLSYKEISKRLDISVNTVENQMATALSFLRKNLGEESFVALLFCYLFI